MTSKPFHFKVLQKLNSKTNAAGWVPSSFNRTAGSFSSSQGTGKSISGLPGVKLQTMQHKKPTDADDTWNSIFPVENEELVYGIYLYKCIKGSNLKLHILRCVKSEKQLNCLFIFRAMGG